MLELKDLSAEEWREYDFDKGMRVYRILEPKWLSVGITTHRVIDQYGVVHCFPAPGHLGCVLRWMPKDGAKPIQF